MQRARRAGPLAACQLAACAGARSPRPRRTRTHTAPARRSWFTTVAPLVFVLTVNAVKEGYDDACRHRNDKQVNNRRVLMLDEAAGEVPVFWKDIVAGDFIKARARSAGRTLHDKRRAARPAAADRLPRLCTRQH